MDMHCLMQVLRMKSSLMVATHMRKNSVAKRTSLRKMIRSMGTTSMIPMDNNCC